MNFVWQKLTLSHLSLYRWQGSSYAYRLVGILRSWREGSWLMQWSEGIGALLISLVFVLGPFVSTAIIGVVLMAGACYLGLLTLSDEGKSVITPIHLLVFLYWGINTIATAFSPVRQAAISGLVKLTLYLLFFALCAKVLRQPKLRSGIMTIYLLVSLWVSVYGIRQHFFGARQLATWNDPTSALAGDTRVYSYLGNPNLLAGYLLTAVALSVAAVLIWQRLLPKFLAVVMVGINSACLYFTDSRGGWLALVGLMSVFALLLYYWWRAYLPKFWRIWLVPLVFGTLGGLLMVAIITVEPLRLRIMSIFAGREDSSNNFRLNVWDAVREMIRDRPWLGIGPGNSAFNQVYPRYMRPNYTALSAYSIFLETIVEVGYIGFAIFMWLIVVTFNQGLIQLSKLKQLGDRQGIWLIAACAAMVGLLVQGLFDTVWYRPQINTLWWLMTALIASYYPAVKDLTSARQTER